MARGLKIRVSVARSTGNIVNVGFPECQIANPMATFGRNPPLAMDEPGMPAG
jgi:hypothetical protein